MSESERESGCVCQRSEPVEVSYKGPPQLCRQTGNCCAFSQFHMAPSVSFAPARLFLALSNQPKAPGFSSRLPTLCTNLSTTTHLFPYSPPSTAPFSLLLVPGWASLLDQTGGGVVLQWCSRRSPVYRCLFIQPPHCPCSPN